MGDIGCLLLDGCCVLCQLLIGLSIDQLCYVKLWLVLICNEVVICLVLLDLFLELVLDCDSGVVFIWQVDIEDIDVLVLLCSLLLIFIDLVLLLYLCQQLVEVDVCGNCVVVVDNEMVEVLVIYEKNLFIDCVGFN